jgi:hypothetical protein
MTALILGLHMNPMAVMMAVVSTIEMEGGSKMIALINTLHLIMLILRELEELGLAGHLWQTVAEPLHYP